MKFVSDLRQVGGFLWVLRFPPPTQKNDRHDVNEILLKVALNTITPSKKMSHVSVLYLKGPSDCAHEK
jgi:hypothetical protein